MQYADIPGLNQLKKQLVSAYKKGKVAHAQLFSGTLGTAALPMAMAHASYLMCENKSPEDSCGTCPNCVRTGRLVHPDMHWYFPKISASDTGKYDKVLSEAFPLWRTFVRENPYGSFEDWAIKYGQENKNLQISREDSRQILKQASMHAVEGGYKIIFIWRVENMHPSAANALLKALEEPPEKTIYLLVSFHYDNILSTITSRTQFVSIPPNSDEEIRDFLIQKHQLEPSHAMQVAELAEGKIGNAIRSLENDEHVAYNQFRDWMLVCWNRNFTSLVNKSEDFSKAGKNKQRSFLLFSLSLIRSALIKAVGVNVALTNGEEEIFIQRYADKLGTGKLEQIYLLLNDAVQHLERNSNPRITYLNLSLSITRKLNT